MSISGFCFVHSYNKNTQVTQKHLIYSPYQKEKFEEDSECAVFQEEWTNMSAFSLHGKISSLFYS